MQGVLSYISIGKKVIEISIEGKDQDELFANGRKEWEKAQSNKNESERPAPDAKPGFRFS